MKCLGMLALPLLLAAPAGAMDRHNIDGMSCLQIGAALDKESPALLVHQSRNVPGMMLFSTYVGSREDCRGGQTPVRRSVRAEDGPCRVYQCVTPSRSWMQP
jgi:hypothetical protein